MSAPWIDEDGQERWSDPPLGPDFDGPGWPIEMAGPLFWMWRSAGDIMRREDCPCCGAKGYVIVAYP